MYLFGVVEELPDGLKFLILAVVPAAEEQFLVWLAGGHLPG
jgi:hypothetical protein